MAKSRWRHEVPQRTGRTLYFLIVCLVSLLCGPGTLPVLVAVADVAFPCVLFAVMSHCARCQLSAAVPGGVTNGGATGVPWLVGRVFKTSLVDVPVVAAVRSFAAIGSYFFCSGPWCLQSPYLLITSLSAIVSTAYIALKAAIFDYRTAALLMSAGQNSAALMSAKNASWLAPLVFLGGLVFAGAQVGVALWTTWRAKNKLQRQGLDEEWAEAYFPSPLEYWQPLPSTSPPIPPSESLNLYIPPLQVPISNANSTDNHLKNEGFVNPCYTESQQTGKFTSDFQTKNNRTSSGVVFVGGSEGGEFPWKHFLQKLEHQIGCKVDMLKRPKDGGERKSWGGVGGDADELEELVLHLIHFCKSLQLQRVVLVGHSDGVKICLRAAAHSHRGLQILGICSFNAVSNSLEGTLMSALRSLPILVIAGLNDTIVDSQESALLAAQLGFSARLLVLPNCGHMPHEEAPGALLAALVPFVTSALGLGVNPRLTSR